MSNFVHLHAHSEYSLDSGFFNISDYIKMSYEYGFSCASITERFNLFSAIKFYKKCFDFGIKPIIGCEVFLNFNDVFYSKYLFFCKNYNGYKNLIALLSKAYLNKSENGIPIIKYKWLSNLSNDLIVVAVSFESDLGKFLINNDFNSAEKIFYFWNKIFKNRYYLSITRMGILSEELLINRVMEFIVKNKLALIATNEISFLKKSDILSYKLKTKMFDNGKEKIFNYDKYLSNKYFKSYEEMLEIFSDLPNVISNTLELSKRCNLFFKFGMDYSPKFIINSDFSMENFLFKFSYNKLLLDNFFHRNIDLEIYVNRLKVEIDTINSIGFANYFLVTYDFINWAKYNDILVGPGRGSGAGSLVAYLLSITGIDPIKHDLLFERFLNKDRKSTPDFDVDFCIEGRDLVMDYIFDIYGINNVSQIITFGCMTVKSAIRDIGRVLGYSYNFVDRLVKIISNNFGISLKSELVNNIRLRTEYNNSSDVQTILNLSLKIEGMIKGIGKHAGGLIISSVELLTYLPLYYEMNDYNFVTQFDKDDSELFGFTKFDFLGLKTLTILSNIIDTFCTYLSLNSNFLFDFDYLFLDDNRTYDLLSDGDTLGIFQFESNGIKSILQKVKPDIFSDIVSLIALYRPGPLQSGLLLSFMKRKIGLEKIDYINDRLESVLKETYGVIVYQEQVMLMAQIFANYTLADADLLRIAMSKKKTKEMLLHLEYFIYGASLNGIDKNTAENVFFLVEKFAGYGFNKAHSVGYGLLAYQTAWFKSNYNIIFLTSLLSSDIDNNDNYDLYIEECNHFGIRVIAPDINRSFYCSTILNENEILFGFGSIKGLGKSLISEIIFKRAFFGYYNNFFDFLYKMDLTLLTKKVLQSLVYSGVFDKLDKSRFKLVLISNKFFDLYNNYNYSNIFSFEPILDIFFNSYVKKFKYMIDYKNLEFLNNRDLLGKYLFDNQLKNYINDINSIINLSFKSGIYFNEFFCGIIDNITSYSSYDLKITILGLYDIRDFFISVFRYKSKKDIIKIGKFIVICGYFIDKKFYELLIEDFFLFRYYFAVCINIYFHKKFISNFFLKNFFKKISNKVVKGNTCIRFYYFSFGKYNCISFYDDFNISLHDELISDLKKFKEISYFSINYSFK